MARLADAVAARAPFELAGRSPIVTVSGSLIAALALFEGAVGADSVWAAAQVDEAWQAEQWGEDDLSARARAATRPDFSPGARLLRPLPSRAGAFTRLEERVVGSAGDSTCRSGWGQLTSKKK